MTDPGASGRHLVLGTAGHIDHGKTALIKAMTGIDTDRLKEEKERGISIELGYAELELPSGTRLSVVDVPGHERFVRNMVAGASGIDIFLLVVAADDGVMPQTREHMAIIEMLGIPQGIIAVTKTDLVDAEMIELVRADVEDFLAGTPYAEAPLVTVSSKTGDGIPLLLGLLEDAAAKAGTAHEQEKEARLPVDRVFTLKGIGTVVTGTLWSGQICGDDSIRLMPDELTGRARTVQVHDRMVECASAGQRVAINISGIDKERLRRGQMVVTGTRLAPTYMVDARIHLLPSARALKYGAQARFHHGTADATAKLMFVDRDRLEPGESCYAQVRLRTKIVPERGDRFILRSLTPVNTIGGGVVVDAAPHKHGKGEAFRNRLETLEHGSPREIVALLLFEAGDAGLRRRELAARSLLPEETLAEVLADSAAATVLPAATGEIVFHPEASARLRKAVLDALLKRQKESPADPTLGADELARAAALAPAGASFQAVVAWMLTAGDIAAQRNRYSLASAEAKLSDSQKQLMESVALQLEEAGFGPSSVGEMKSALGASDSDMKLALKMLTEDGRAVRVKPDLYFAAGVVDNAQEKVIEHCQEKGRITLAEFRDLLGVSRKFAQALLEYFDRAGLTRRIEDYRVLRGRGATSAGR